jgi:tRNA threonylcarbamoyladenosine biosynthesis protein TsaE
MQQKSRHHWSIPTPQDWDAIAIDIAKLLKPGDIVALKGPLGAGKTTCVQALARALGAKKIPKSPTFSMLRTYAVRYATIKRLLHVDAYRIEREYDLLPLDLDAELAVQGTMLVLEWPERVPRWIGARQVKTLTIEVRARGRYASFG